LGGCSGKSRFPSASLRAGSPLRRRFAPASVGMTIFLIVRSVVGWDDKFFVFALIGCVPG
jgi:hypothetical protein